MVAIWWNASTYGHCLFVPILVAWLVQQRLPGLRRLEPSAWAPGLLWLGLGAFAWMLGAAAGVAVVRHGALVMMLQGSVRMAASSSVSTRPRSEEHTSELQSLMRISYAVFCLKKKNTVKQIQQYNHNINGTIRKK